MRRAKALGLAGVGLSLAVGTTLAVGTADAAPTAKQNQQTAKQNQQELRPAVTGAFVPVPPGQNRTASVRCPAGTRVTGGGGQTSAFRIFLTGSYFSGNTWFVRGTNTGRATEQIRAVAVCR